MATARSQPKPKAMVANPFGLSIRTFQFDCCYDCLSFVCFSLGIMINPRQRPTLLQATRAATAFTTSLALPGGYTYDII